MLVLVNGAPASGKSSLARILSDDLGLPVVAKDAIKEILFETLGAPDRATSGRLSAASYELLWTTIAWLLAAGAGAVVDCNVRRGVADHRLAPLLAQARAVLVQCRTTPEEIARRYRQRVQRSERHPGHFDAAFLDELRPEDAAHYGPLDLAVPTLVVDTTQGYQPDAGAILAFIRRSVEPHG